MRGQDLLDEYERHEIEMKRVYNPQSGGHDTWKLVPIEPNDIQIGRYFLVVSKVSERVKAGDQIICQRAPRMSRKGPERGVFVSEASGRSFYAYNDDIIRCCRQNIDDVVRRLTRAITNAKIESTNKESSDKAIEVYETFKKTFSYVSGHEREQAAYIEMTAARFLAEKDASIFEGVF